MLSLYVHCWALFWNTDYSQHFKANLKLAGPIILAQLGQMTVNIVDNIMIGHVGRVPLAALSLALAMYFVFFIAILGLNMGINPLISEADGASRPREVSSFFSHGLILNILGALLMIGAAELLSKYVYLLGQDPQVLEQAMIYFRINMYSLIPFMIFLAFRSLSEGLSETRAPMIAMILGNMVNVLMNYILIFGHFGFPAMGVEGAAIGTFISRCWMLLCLFFLLLAWRKKSSMHTLMKEHIAEAIKMPIRLDCFWRILKIGVPSSLQSLFEIGSFAGAAILMGRIGPSYQAAHQITINSISATFMICVGIASASTIRVGNHLGRKDFLGMRKAGFSGIYLTLIFMCFTAALFILLRFLIPGFYISDVQVETIAASLFVIAALFQLSDGVQVSAIGALRGMQDMTFPTLATFIAYICIGLPFSYYSAFALDWGYLGIWMGLFIGLTMSAVLNMWRYNAVSKKFLSLPS